MVGRLGGGVKVHSVWCSCDRSPAYSVNFAQPWLLSLREVDHAASTMGAHYHETELLCRVTSSQGRSREIRRSSVRIAG